MAKKLKTQDVVRLTGTTRRRVEAWARSDGTEPALIDIPKARPRVWDAAELLAAALVTVATNTGAPLGALRGIEQLIREAGPVERLRSARLMVTLPTRADTEKVETEGTRWTPPLLVLSAGKFEEVMQGAIPVLGDVPTLGDVQTHLVVHVGEVLLALEKAGAELSARGALDEREGVEVA